MYKYPRTHHLEGSRFQPGDEELDKISFQEIANRPLVIEEKVDGANAALSFTPEGQLLLQSRGHYLTGGAREKHFNLFKQWANCHALSLWKILTNRYIVYGEWLYAKHTIFYDQLPHYFLEFDILDLEQHQFLSTKRRQSLLAGLPIISVPVLFSGHLHSPKQLNALLTHSQLITAGNRARLIELAEEKGLDLDKTLCQTDTSQQMEGLYIKIEEEGIVKARYKYVRTSFLTVVEQSESHWLNRPIIPNLLRPGVDLFSPNSPP